MIIKSFTADSVAAALKAVRTELGGDAVVLKTRQTVGDKGESRIEVTACLDKTAASQASTSLGQDGMSKVDTAGDRTVSKPSPAEIRSLDLGYGDTGSLSSRLDAVNRKLDLLLSIGNSTGGGTGVDDESAQAVYYALLGSGVPEEFAQAVLTNALRAVGKAGALGKAVWSELTSQLSDLMASEPQFKPGDRVMFMGPAGSGKTSVLGKVAAELVSGGVKVRLVSLDENKIGGLDEIHSYGDLLGTDVLDTRQLSHAYETSDSEVLLIDSPALSADPERVAGFAIQVEQLKPNCRVFVLSSLFDTGDMARLAKGVMSLEPTHLVMTMLDLTRRWGCFVAACKVTGLRLSLVSDAPSGLGQVHLPSVDQMVSAIMRQESCHE